MHRVFHRLINTLPFMLLATVILNCGCFRSKDENKGLPTSTTVVRYGSLALSARAPGSIVWANLTPVRAHMSGRIDEIKIVENQTLQSGQCAAVMSSHQRAALVDLAKHNSPEELEKWKTIYESIPILAPIGGIVTEVSVTAGQSVVQDQTLFVIGDTRIARLFVEETEVSIIEPGDTAHVTVFALQGAVLTGTVSSIGSQSTAHRSAVTYAVDVAIEEWPKGVKTGMSLNAVFSGPHRDHVLLVPCTAVANHAGKDCVCIVDKDDNISFTPVKTGLTEGVDVEVLDGIEEGHRVLIDAGARTSLQVTGKSQNSPLIPFTNRH